MEIVYHLGAHSTDDDQLVRSLAKNQAALGDLGIVVPPPWQYRQLFREIRTSLQGQEASQDMQTALLDTVTDGKGAERLIFSHDLFLCPPDRIVTKEGFYAQLARRVHGLANVFPAEECEFHLALRNPATLIPEHLARQKNMTYEDLMGATDPRALRWGPTVAGCVRQNPDQRMVIWCNEDTPLIWPDILRQIAGVDTDEPLIGDSDALLPVLTPEGQTEVADAFADDKPRTRRDRLQIMTGILQDHALTDAMEMAIDLPGWTEDIIERMTSDYDSDVAMIAGLPGVVFLSP